MMQFKSFVFVVADTISLIYIYIIIIIIIIIILICIYIYIIIYIYIKHADTFSHSSRLSAWTRPKHSSTD